MLYLSQRDPRWANLKLGSSSLTISKFGCTTTSISMLSDYFGCYQSPDKIAANPNNYTKEGLIVWQNLKFEKMKFQTRLRVCPPDSTLIEILKDPNRAVIANVDDGHHWVVLVKKNVIGKDWTCVDPWSGSKCDVFKTYRNIVGVAIFNKA